jgi:serine/threonine protein kinase
VEAASLLRQLVSSLLHMHSNGIAHCDLKPDNFLFVTPNDGTLYSTPLPISPQFRTFCGQTRLLKLLTLDYRNTRKSDASYFMISQ